MVYADRFNILIAPKLTNKYRFKVFYTGRIERIVFTKIQPVAHAIEAMNVFFNQASKFLRNDVILHQRVVGCEIYVSLFIAHNIRNVYADFSRFIFIRFVGFNPVSIV